MTVLLNLVRAVERRESSLGGMASKASVLQRTAEARVLLDTVANAGATEALAELLWKAEPTRARAPWPPEGLPQAADDFRTLARVALTSGLVPLTKS